MVLKQTEIDMTHICHRYCLPTAWEVGENRHAQEVMRALGITYAAASAHSLGEQWWFWDCQNLPDPLPPYLAVAKSLGDMEFEHYHGDREIHKKRTDCMMCGGKK
jgi:hypothetical protein